MTQSSGQTHWNKASTEHANGSTCVEEMVSHSAQEKFILAQDTVEFVGFEITTNCVRPCKRFLQAITDFPIPHNITDVRSWFGLVNQVAYAFSMTEKMFPLCDLLKQHTPFRWDDQLNESFQLSKDAIMKSKPVSRYLTSLDPSALPLISPKLELDFSFDFDSLLWPNWMGHHTCRQSLYTCYRITLCPYRRSRHPKPLTP